MQNWQATLQDQFGNSPRLIAMIESFNDAIDPAGLTATFYANLWNIETAVGYGLDVWGRIVNVGRVLTIPAGEIPPFFGFEQAIGGGEIDSFSVAPFYGGPGSTQSYSLTDSAYRALILVKALSNISTCSSQSINAALMLLFPGRGNAYVVDNLDMTMNYVFSFALTAVETAIVTQSGALPRPSGVLANVGIDGLLTEAGGYLLTESGAVLAQET